MTENPAPDTVLHLLRHGEVYNPGGVLYGRLPDFHLSEEGRLMAKAAAGFLAAGTWCCCAPRRWTGRWRLPRRWPRSSNCRCTPMTG